MPQLRGYGMGDELVKVNVTIPTNLTARQKSLLEEFAKLQGEDLSSRASFTDKIKRAFK